MLAELLELLHTSDDRWTSLKVDLGDWQDHDRLQAVADQASAAFFEAPPTRRPPGAPHAGECTGIQESTLSVTATSRRAVRVEKVADGGQDLLIVSADAGVLGGDRRSAPGGRRRGPEPPGLRRP